MSRIVLEGKLASETVSEVFDFTSRCSAAETISSASTVATVYSGTDASPSSLVSGSASISGQKVSQKIAAGVVGVMYKLVCSATTSLGQTLQLSAFLAVIPDTE